LSVITDQLNLPLQGVIVIWEWEWCSSDKTQLFVDHVPETSLQDGEQDSVDHVSETLFGEQDSVDHVSETSFGDQDYDEASFYDSDETNCDFEDDDPLVTSTVTFKCIGTQHDMHAQNILSKVSQLIESGQQVPVNLYKEPDNPYDAKAVAFKCWVDDEWHRIGYVVREALDDVHHAMETSSIIDVKFTWAKYLIIWMKSGPGYYAGISITRYGEWSREVCRSASTR